MMEKKEKKLENGTKDKEEEMKIEKRKSSMKC